MASFEDCQNLYQSILLQFPENGNGRIISQDAQNEAEWLKQEQELSQCRFWEQSKPCVDVICLADDTSDSCSVIDVSESETTNTITITKHEFKRQYIQKNIPCVIRGLDKNNFSNLAKEWSDANSNTSTRSIRKLWFLERLGKSHVVPVRISPPPSTDQEQLDIDGRAKECQTDNIPLEKWVEQMESDEPDPSRYLKDWHLLQDLAKGDETHDTQIQLYTVPKFLKKDLLNDFLTRYSDGGDYRFTYWGPKGSTTDLHSDVLNSFSWSHNVVGSKRWIFHSNVGESTLELIQNSGETVFVPATWKHSVENLVETLSVNHNWITYSNVHFTWKCIQVEIDAVSQEIAEWGLPRDDFCVQEQMLQGCIGMNVSAFFFMLLVALLNLIDDLRESEGKITNSDDEEDVLWEKQFEFSCLRQAIKAVLTESKIQNAGGDLHLIERLSATLGCEESALFALEMAEYAVGSTCRSS